MSDVYGNYSRVERVFVRNLFSLAVVGLIEYYDVFGRYVYGDRNNLYVYGFFEVITRI